MGDSIPEIHDTVKRITKLTFDCVANLHSPFIAELANKFEQFAATQISVTTQLLIYESLDQFVIRY